ncbi:MAG TPA: ElyC/SanA/YdcF family protein [Candidatus Paceibacterota bacterium]|nr:ElyC/SanA/YdcF family protein [Candidatus Paceibacterota bacterium]
MVRKFFHFSVLIILFAVLCATAIVGYIDVTSEKYIYLSKKAPPAEVALVLGASVTSRGVLSPILKERADMAAALYQSGTVRKILVTGDNGTLTYDEVYPVGKYLLALGIPQDDIFLDYAGFDTYSSMYRARDVFGVTSVLIVTQKFHLSRAVFIARSLGLEAYGVDAAAPGERFFTLSLREIPASLKASYDVWFGRVPKYLGEQFPVSGSGVPTWVGGSSQMIYFGHGR